MRRILFLVLLVLMTAACGRWWLGDCSVTPLPNPVFEIEGEEGPGPKHVQLNGEVVGIIQEEGRIEIVLADEELGQ